MRLINLTIATLLFIILVTISPEDTLFSANGMGQNLELSPQYFGAPTTPIQAMLSIDRYPPVGQPTTLTCIVSSALNSPGTTVEIELPGNVRYLSGDLTWQGDLLVGNPITLTTTVVFEAAGDLALFCRAHRFIDAENSWGDLAALYLSVGLRDSKVGFAPTAPDERDKVGELDEMGDGQIINQVASYPAVSLTSQAVEPPPGVTPSTSDSPQVASSGIGTAGTLTITGRWRFYDRADSLMSEQILVEVVRGDDSSHLAWCYTAIDGNYSCGPFTNPGIAGVRARFLSYTSFNPYNDVLVTVNPDWGIIGSPNNAFGTTTSVQTFSDGTHDIGSWLVPNGSSYERAYWIVQDLIRVWKYIWFSTGSVQNPQETAGPATVEWKIDSTDGTYYSPGQNIHLAGEDPLSNTVVGHEYGHNIQYTIYGNLLPPAPNCNPHSMIEASSTGCAWLEGWANFLALAVNNDPNFRWPSGAQLNLENPTWGSPTWTDGDSVEGRVAGALWDILDSVNENDDQYSDGGITNIWDTLYHQNDNTFSEYWAAWKSRGHNNTSAGPVMAIFQNTIDYRNGPPNDDFASATIISNTPYVVTNLNTINATTQGRDPNISCGFSAIPKQSRSVWYRFTPSQTGSYIINTNGSNYDTVLALWTGTFGSLTNQGCNDNNGTGLQSQLTPTLQNGITYYIEVIQYGSGSGGTLKLSVNTMGGPEGPPLDVYFLVDLSGSFSDDLPVFKAEAPTIISTLLALNSNTRFGLGRFEDYPIGPFGSAAFGDKAYERVVDLTLNSNAVLSAIAGLSTRFGDDQPESQLAALYQTATGAGQNLSGVGYPGASIPPGLQANFRPEATKLILLWTDASFHQPGDPGNIPYPGPGFDQTANVINALGDAFVLGILADGATPTATTADTLNQQVVETSDIAIASSASDLTRIVVATGAFAGDSGVDCDHDGTLDLFPGQPLVCDSGVSGYGIGDAIIALVTADRGPARAFLPLIFK